MNATELTPELTDLLTAARGLPAQLVRQVAEFAEFLGHKHASKPEPGDPGSADASEDWTQEELRELTVASLRRFEAEHPDEVWGTDYTRPREPECSPPGT